MLHGRPKLFAVAIAAPRASARTGYQMRMRSAGGLYIPSPGLVPKAS
jgi:hypothetical protein